jgi:peptide chain release factor 1
MFAELEKKREKYIELEKELSSPDLIKDREKYKQKAKEYSNLKSVIAEYDSYNALVEEKESLQEVIAEEDEKSEYSVLAKDELVKIEEALETKKRVIEDILLDGQSSDNQKNVIMEIRAGTGGVEACLFASDLYRMYTKYANELGWKISVISLSESEIGGLKEIIFSIEGQHVYKFMRFELGTHRVQRVPETESGGRIHTSAATVAVLPEAEEVEVNIDPQDLRIDTFRASGAGGQHVNTTDSAIRITYLPTGIVVSCQDERSQHKNKVKAMRVLRARVLEESKIKHDKEIRDERKKQVGSGDRSEKIRTYNFPENRITDHRIKVSLYNLANILEGDLNELISKLLEEDRRIKLQKA